MLEMLLLAFVYSERPVLLDVHGRLVVFAPGAVRQILVISDRDAYR